MRFGYTLPNHYGVEDPADLVGLASEAEGLGFDSVWVSHHLLNLDYIAERLGTKPYYDPLTVLTWVASSTERIRLGTSVLVLPLLEPMALSKQLATIDIMSGGRLDVGVGVGGMRAEIEALGFDLATRGTYTDESIEVMKALWTGEAVSYAGRHFSFSGALASPAPLQAPHPPLLVGGSSDRSLRRAARYGDGWHASMLLPEQMAPRLERLDEELEAVGRTRGDLSLSVRLVVGEAVPHDTVEAYAELGVEEVAFEIETGDVAEQRRWLRALAAELIPSS